MSGPVRRWIIALAIASLMMGLVLVHAARAQEAIGQWHGTITSPESGDILRVGVEIARGADGKLTGSATSPDQTADRIPIEAISFEGSTFSFTSEAVMGRYEATWDASRGAWTGQWRQAGTVLPLALEKGPVPATAKP